MIYISRLMVLLIFSASATMCFTACNKEKVVVDSSTMKCCSDQTEKCSKDGEKACFHIKAGEKVTESKSSDEKACCKHKSDKNKGASVSSSTKEAHLCGDNCDENGCTHEG